MRRPRFTIAMLITAATLVLAATLSVVAQEASPAAPRPQESETEAAERATQEAICSTCHEASLVKGSFRMPEQWDEAFAQMQSYGMQATPEQINQIRSFLLRNYGRAKVNNAPAQDLSPVLDVPLAVAEAVITYRHDNGPFKTLDDLKKVPGMDPAKVDARKARLMF
jgi:competence protein ComEA